MSKRKIKYSLKKIQPVKGYLFPIEVVDENSELCERPRAVWIEESSDKFKIRYAWEGKADWLDTKIRQYVTDQLKTDGFDIIEYSLEIQKINKDKNDDKSPTTIETN